MHHFKYFLIILASSFLLMSCGDENANTPSTTPTENEDTQAQDSSTSLGNENENENENSQTQDSSTSLGNEDSPTTQNPDPSPTSLGDANPQAQDPSLAPVNPPPRDSDYVVTLECIEGVYTGRTDFERATIGRRPYKLEVNHNYNSNEMIFLLTNTETGLETKSQICTIYQNPILYGSMNEPSFNIASESIEIRGEIIDTKGIFSILASAFEGELTPPPSSYEGLFCGEISEFLLFREGDDLGSLGWFGWNSPRPRPERVTDEELRSFDEIKSDCDALPITSTLEIPFIPE